MSLKTLPIELIHLISDNLPTKHVFTVVRSINKRFYKAISDVIYWQRRFLRFKLPGKVSCVYFEEFVKLCANVEDEMLFWSRHNGGHDFIKTGKSVLNFLTVDALMFIRSGEKNLLVTASRDQCIRIFDTTNTTAPICTLFNAHNSWINNLIPIQSSLVSTFMLSSGFDGSLRLWQLPSSKTNLTSQNPLSELALKSTVIDSALSPTTPTRLYFLCADNCIRLITLSFNSSPILKPLARIIYFKCQTLSIAVDTDSFTNNTFLFMSSRSKWLVSLECTSFSKKFATMLDSEALCVKVSGSRVYCGLKSGNVVVLTLNLMTIKITQAFSANIGVTRLKPTMAYLICTSRNGLICVFSLCGELVEIRRGRCPSSISAAHCEQNKFALALSDCSVNLFT